MVQDENSGYLAANLMQYGVQIRRILTVPDEIQELKSEITRAVEQSDLVITTGGLGPSQSDVTRESLCSALATDTVIDSIALEALRSKFTQRGVAPMPEWASKLARIPRGAEAILNSQGLASGIFIKINSKVVASLPGEPEEVKSIWTESLKHRLVEHFGLKESVHTLSLQAATGEPSIIKTLDEWISGKADPRVKLTIIPKPGVMTINLMVDSADQEEGLNILQASALEIRKRLGASVFGEGEDTVEDALVRVLAEQNLTISVAESSTGGAICSRIVNVPGASAVFIEGFVCYSNESKIARLNVPSEFIRMYGAVSESVVMAMASGVRAVTGSDVGLAVTGILGPTGGTDAKPVGTTWIACDVEGALTTLHMQLAGNRRSIKRWAARAAINFARLSVLRSAGAF